MHAHRELVHERPAIGGGNINPVELALRQRPQRLVEVQRYFQRAREQVHRPRRQHGQRHFLLEADSGRRRDRTIAATRQQHVRSGVLGCPSKLAEEVATFHHPAFDRMPGIEENALGSSGERRHVQRPEGAAILVQNRDEMHAALRSPDRCPPNGPGPVTVPVLLDGHAEIWQLYPHHRPAALA